MKKYYKLIFGSILTLVIMLSSGCTSLNAFFQEAEKVNTKNVFSNLLITNTSLNFTTDKKFGILKGKVSNASERTLGGNFNIVFYAKNGGINKIYNTPLPGLELKPHETKVFSVKIDKFEYETYDFIDDNIFEKASFS